jgi:NAD(P)-dependent dehydrogenase (short-subunit alcohol dehydrogenase family)
MARIYIARPEDGIVWLTGASSGIGYELAKALTARGFRVAVTARGTEQLSQLQTEAPGPGEIIVMAGDVSDRAAMAKMADAIEAIAPITLVIPNAGVYDPQRAEDFTLDSFDKTMDVNVSGAMYVIAPAMEKMIARGWGQISVMASVAGYGGLPLSIAYGPSKAALINLAEALRFDLDALGVRVQVINPGFVDTPATAQNEFNMPALLQPENAANRIADGLVQDRFEITFPKRFTWILKFLNILPYPAYFRAAFGLMQWRKEERAAMARKGSGPDIS